MDPNVRIVIISSNAQNAISEQRASEAGADAYVQKPATWQILKTHVDIVLGEPRSDVRIRSPGPSVPSTPHGVLSVTPSPGASDTLQRISSLPSPGTAPPSRAASLPLDMDNIMPTKPPPLKTNDSLSLLHQPSLFGIAVHSPQASLDWSQKDQKDIAALASKQAVGISRESSAVDDALSPKDQLTIHTMSNAILSIDQDGKSGAAGLVSQNELTPAFDADGSTPPPLWAACKEGDAALVKQLLLQGKHNLDDTFWQGRTAVYMAAKNGHESCLSMMLEARADINLANHQGMSPVCAAVREDKERCLSLLIEHKANLDRPNSDGHSPVFLASQLGQLSCLDLLIEAKADIHQRNRHKQTPMFIAGVSGHTQIINRLIAAGGEGDVNSKDDKGWTPLAAAFSTGKDKTALALFKYGADPAMIKHVIDKKPPFKEMKVITKDNLSTLEIWKETARKEAVTTAIKEAKSAVEKSQEEAKRVKALLKAEAYLQDKQVQLKLQSLAVSSAHFPGSDAFGPARLCENADCHAMVTQPFCGRCGTKNTKQKLPAQLEDHECTNCGTYCHWIRADTAKQGYHVFLSHAQGDASAVMMAMATGLELQEGMRVWYDQNESDRSLVGMIQGVVDSRCFLVYLTKNYFSRPYCCFELLIARRLNKPIVAMREDSNRPEWHPISFEELKAIDPELAKLDVFPYSDTLRPAFRPFILPEMKKRIELAIKQHENTHVR
eukprot:g60509.t1